MEIKNLKKINFFKFNSLLSSIFTLSVCILRRKKGAKKNPTVNNTDDNEEDIDLSSMYYSEHQNLNPIGDFYSNDNENDDNELITTNDNYYI